MYQRFLSYVFFTVEFSVIIELHPLAFNGDDSHPSTSIRGSYFRLRSRLSEKEGVSIHSPAWGVNEVYQRILGMVKLSIYIGPQNLNRLLSYIWGEKRPNILPKRRFMRKN